MKNQNFYNIYPMGFQGQKLSKTQQVVFATPNAKRMYRMKYLFTRHSLSMPLAILALVFGLNANLLAQVYTFTNAGATGSFGPTQPQVDSAYNATTLDGQVTISTQGIQEWTVPVSGTYRIQALGATGGNQNEVAVSVGHPADISGDFYLTAGQSLKILVGQHGFMGSSRPGWGGGGGSFVALQDNTPLIVAGGCGSGHTGTSSSGLSTQNANVSQTGKNGSGGSGSWTVGFGATGGHGGDGAGFLGNGSIGHGGGYLALYPITVPMAFINGGVGSERGGGFGGGAGVTSTQGGGGGGYSGGQGAVGGPYFGGGGGSFNSGSNPSNVLSSNNEFVVSHGQVTITYLCLQASIYTQPTNSTVCENANTAFSIGSIDADAHQWQVNDGMGWVDVSGPGYSGATDSTLLITGAGLAMDGYQYRVIAIGCSGNDTSNVATLTVNSGPAATASTIANATCNGYPNGSAQVFASGGTAPYTYSWSPAGGTDTVAVGLTAGTYTVTVTDLNACQATAQTIITQPAAFNVSSSQTNVSCNGENDGMASVSVSGGSSPYAYDWAPGTPAGDGTAGVSGLTAGAYSVTVTDSNGCQTTQLFTITEPAPLVAGFGAQTDVSCNGADDGSTTVTVSGGTPSYSYSWAPSGGSAATANGLAPGSYTVTVTDLKGCTDTETFTVSEPNQLVLTHGAQDDVLCFGDSSGTAAVNVAGGTGPYNFLWSDGQTTQTAVGLASGNYTVWVTDDNGCTDSLSFGISQPASPVSLTALSQTDIPCPGGVSGAASVNLATGGVPGYTYDWTGSPLGDGTTSITNLSAGTYTCTVTDFNGCRDSVSFIISDVDTVPPVAIAQNFTAYLSSLGTVSVSPSQVNNGSSDICGINNIQLTPNFFTCANIGPNQVVLTVTDDNGNVDTASAIITVIDDEYPVLTAPGNVTYNTSAGLCTGTGALGTATASDNCSYLITNDAPPAFPVGNTTVTWYATDPSGNVDSATQVVTIQDVELPTVITQDITVQLDSTGVVAISAAQIDNGSNDACGIDSIGVSPGAFNCSNVGLNVVTLTVVDVHGNIAVGTANVTVVDNIVPNVVTQNITVYLDASGNVAITGADVDNGSTDNCGIDSLGVTPDAFTCADVGNNTVTLTVVDVNGNSAASTATVTVLDTIAPVAIAQNITVQLDATGNVTISGNDIDNGSNDACGLLSLSASPNSFTCAEVGANTVILTVTDLNGNISVDTAIVTVQDVTPPVITCPLDVTVSNDAGLCSASGVGLGTPVTTDSCGIFSVTNDGLASYPVGVTTVTWTVVDVNGHSNTCAQTVTVNDTERPVISCQADTVLCGSQVVNYPVPTATDNCGFVTTTTIPYSGAPISITNNNVFSSFINVAQFGPTALGAGVDLQNVCFDIQHTYVGDIIVSLRSPNGTVVPLIDRPGRTGSGFGCSGDNISMCVQTGTGLDAENVCGNLPAISGTYFAFNGADLGSINNGGSADGIWELIVSDNASGDQGAIIGWAMTFSAGSQIIQTAGLPTGSTFPVGTTTNTYVAVDVSGNTDTCSFDVIINPIPVASVSNQTLCHNEMSAAISFGGVDTVYTWTNDETSIGLAANGTGDIAAFTATNNGLVPVTANITVTPEYTNAGLTCTGTPTVFTITVNPNPSTSTSHTDATCFGLTDGTAIVVASGGTPGYAYSWSSGGTADVETGLGAGTYYVTVSDTNGCITTDSVTISEPVLLVNTPSQTNVSCFAGNDGTATAGIAGGTPGYTYSWAPYGGNAATATGLVAGTYTLTVTDSNGCMLMDTYTITQPSPINILPSSNNVSCNGESDGNATVAVSGGTPGVTGYTYSWAPSGGAAATAVNLAAGIYTVTVTDSLGCIATQTFTITEPAPLAAAMSSTSTSCNGFADGTANAAVSGGTPPYSYLWSNGQTTANISGLSAGIYSVDIIDAKSCTLTDTIEVIEPTLLVASYGAQINVSCFGGNDGEATVNVTGGTAPYSYVWTSGGTAATETGLSEGTYGVTVTDSNNCTATYSFTITEPTLLIASDAGQVNVSCFGGSDGEATVSVTGGTAPYSYSWSSGGTSATETGLSAGIHTVTVTDSLGCTATESFTITEPTFLVATDAGQINVSCFGGSDGEATVSVTGGTAPYSYSWSSGGTSATETGLSAGIHTVTVTDSLGCTATESFTITEPTLLVASHGGQTNLICHGDSNGEATVSVTGGTAPYSYLWTSGGTSATDTGLSAGAHTVTVTDSLGCTDTLSFIITEPTQLVADMAQSPATCFGGNDGSAGVIASGGTPGYTYLWSTGDTTAAITNLFAGTYIVTVTDSNGCSTTNSINVTEPTPFNVTGASTNVSCNGGADGTASVSVTGSIPPYTYSWAPGGETTPSVSGLSAGTYTVTITDTNGCSTQLSYTITEPAPLVIAPSQTDVSCNGGSDGAADAVVTGGTLPYAYSWSNGGTGSSINGVPAGIYTVTVKDINNCTATETYTISEPTPVVAGLGSITNVSCNGDADGSLTVNPSGGTPGYTYSWSTGDTTQTIVGLAAGSYTITVTDTNSCTGSATFVVTEPSLLTASASQTHVDCAGAMNGEATVVGSGGTPGYAYLWSDGQITATATGLDAGTYTVEVSDSNGCVALASVTILEHPVYAGGVQVESICQGDSLVFGGNAYHATGLYPHTFTTVNGCDSTVTLDLTVNPVYAGGTETVTICQGDIYTFGGTDYTTAGIYPHTFATVNGCDSTVTLFLFVNPGSYPVYNVTACDSFVFEGNTYTGSGNYVFNHVNVYGCDSIVTLNLIINPSYATTQNSAICQGDTIIFGNTIYTAAGSYTHTFQSVGGCDSVVTLNLTVNPVYAGGSQNNTICQGDSVVFGGTAYHNSGSYAHTFQTVEGCDSTVTLNLTVNPVYAGGVQVEEICDGDSFVFGGTPYATTGLYPHTFTTINGCDSTVTLDLTVHPVYADGIQQSGICQGSSITFNGNVYTTAGFYTETFQTVNGCDSTVTLHLTVNPLSVSSFTVSACDSFVFNGTTYNASGVYTQGYTNVFGCDSTVTLNLTVLPSYAGGVQNEAICQGSGFTFGGTVYTATGSYTHTFNAVNGCDSTVTLNLTVNPSYSGGVQNEAICDGDSFVFGGNSYTAAGQYPHTFQTANGCDSVVTLNLTVNPVYSGGVQNEEICQGQSFIFGGMPYSATGSYTHTFQTVDGCDSTVTLNLTVNPVYVGGIQNTTICQGTSVVFGGTSYTTSGAYTHTFQTVNGCDSTVTMNLTVNPNTVNTVTVSACTDYTFNGQTYTSSGIYTQNYTNMFGCDSTVVLNLTINPAYAGGIQSETICEGSMFMFGGTAYSTTGSYTHTFQTVGGCDSVVTLDLTVNPTYAGGVQNSSICQGQTISFGGTAYGAAGSYTHTFQTVNGCDSTVTLVLSVHPTYAGGVQNETICQGAGVTFGGTTYNTTGSYTHTFQTVNGCDSTVTLNLTVNPTYAGGVQNTTICQGAGVAFGGTVYSSAGVYTHTFQTINGCDSTVTMHLTVNPLSLSSFSVTACDTYVFNGIAYSASGVYTQNYTNISGCDSTVTLDLIIQPSYSGGVQNETICQGTGFTFGGTTYTVGGSYTHTFNAVNGCDSTVTLNLTVAPSYAGGIQNEVICQGESVVFGGNTYNATGLYPHTFQTINGCDSVVTLALTVNPVYVGGVQDETICQGAGVTFGGTVYTASGSYIHTFQSIHGCDSTVTLNLTVNPVYAGGIQNSTICQGSSITFGGVVYTTSGAYTHTFQTVNGCDSTVTMHLTVKPNSSVTFNVSACTSYLFNGIAYNTSGTYLQNYTNVFGCDSTVTLNLTINPAFAGGVQNETICQGSSFLFGGMAYTTAGSYTHTFYSVNGCDSTVTLNLTVNPSYSGGVQTEILCQGQTVSFGGNTYGTTGVYTHTFQTVNGCDSTVTLALTVNPVYTGGVQNNVICQGESVVFGGTAYTTTGNYTHVFQTVNGCDSTVTLNLIVNPTFVGVQNSSICEGASISFGGSVYETAGSYTHVFQTVNGCDSTVTMNLSLLPASLTNLNAEACVSYTLNGQTYASSGVYTQLFTNANGCDSTVTLNLTIHQPTGHTITQVACGSFTINGETYTQSGTYTQSFINSNGCDSTLTLVLTINHVDVGVTQNGNVLTADLAGAAYQWINCTTGMPIVGDTLQSLTVKVNGTYAVVITDGACTDTSACITVANVGIDDVTVVDANVFPNPNEGDFTIRLSTVYPEIHVELYDMTGKLLMRRQFYHTDVMQISEVLASGVYQVRVNAGNQNWVKTIIRK